MDESQVVSEVRAAAAKVFEISNPDAVGLDEDLTLHGLDSLKMAELAGELIQRFGVDPLMAAGEPMLELNQLTIRELTNRVTAILDGNSSAAENGDPESDLATQARADVAAIGGQVRLLPIQSSSRLPLASDDLVPTSMLVVLAYDYSIVEQVPEAIQRGLEAFPQFAGRLDGNMTPFSLVVEPDDTGVIVETGSCDTISLPELDSLSHDDLIQKFLPDEAQRVRNEMLRSPLLSVKATTLGDGGSVLGMVVSHCLIDGTGLSLFMQCCTAAFRSSKAPVPVHSRDVLNVPRTDPLTLPPWYVEHDGELAWEREWSLANRYSLCLFSVADTELNAAFDTNHSNPWFQLTAFLCNELSESDDYSEVALWCDVRGQLSIPTSYSGNVGCYQHEPIGRDGESLATLAERLQASVATSDSGAKQSVAEIYQAIKQTESAGHQVRWLGTEPHVLPVNLVPYSAAPLDFGRGGPQFARILTRNLHGLRISRSPAAAEFVIEACLPGEQAASLVKRCQAKGLVARQFVLEA